MVGEILIHHNTCITKLRDRAAQVRAEVSTQVQASAESDRVIRIRMSRVVVYWMKSHNMFGCYVDEMMKIYLIACWICWLALAYPFCCNVVMYVAVLSCDDHQLGWWEQMGEVHVASKGTMIQQLSHLG